MEKQQQAQALASEIRVAPVREEVRSIGHHGRQQLHDLTRLRIERNRAARHARCAVMSK